MSTTLTDRIRQAARQAGADLVGFAPIARFDQAPPHYHPGGIYPPTRTVIAVAVRQLRGALKAVEEGTYWQSYVCDSYWYLNEVVGPQILRAICLALETDGYNGVPFHNPFHPHRGRKTRPEHPAGPDGMASLRVIGCAAGLGELGLSKIFLTPQFGPRQRVFAVMTEAELEPTPLLDEPVCDRCGACVRECEAGAIGTEPTEVIRIEDKEFRHAPLDCEKCAVIHHGHDPSRSPFYNGSEADGETPSFNQWALHRFRHLSVCVGRGCIRACLDHLEQTGRIEATFRDRFIDKPRWQITEPPAKQTSED